MISIMDDRRCFDLDPCGGRRESADLNERAYGADLIESLRMGAGNMLGISHVNDVHDRTNDVLHSCAGLSQCARYNGQCGPGLHIGIPAQIRLAGRCTGYKDLVSDADCPRISVRVFKGVTGRDVLP